MALQDGAPDPLRGVAPVLLAVLAVGFAASVFAGGFYDLMVWGPIGLGLLALLVALVVGAPARLRGPAAAALAALVVLWLWSWVSASWAESDEQSHIATARWATYAALFGVLLLLLRHGRHRRLVLGFTAAGVVGVCLYVVMTMLAGDAGSLFIGGRLRDPLGYSNGQAGYFLVGLWPLVALAELAKKPALAGLGMAGAFVVASLLLVGQTRGVLPGVAVSAAAMLLLIPGRGRRLWVLILIGVVLAVLSPPLLDVYRETPPGQVGGPSTELAKNAATAILLGAVALGVLWAGVLYLTSGPLRRHTDGRRIGALLPPLATAAAVAVALLAAITLAAASGDPTDRISKEYDAFVNLQLENANSDSRFLSGGGYRYDYWRIAVKQFRSNPLKGIGSGSYDTTYFRDRETGEDIRQPHSFPLQTLGEIGLVGGLALAAFVLAVLVGLGRHARSARSDVLERLVAVGAGGAFVAWLAHTSVDWLHIIPGVTGMALIAAAALVSPAVTATRPGFDSRRRVATTVAVVLAILVGAETVGRPALANLLRIEAQDQLASDPVTALHRANQALSIQDDSLRAHFAKSAAYARLGRYQPAHDTLREAARLEPHDHLPWALLGDVAARHRDLRLARRYYTRASRLNPRDPRLRQVAKDPRMTVIEAREADELQEEAGR